LIYPKATVIVVNYNSRKKWDIVSSSLRCILSLDYRPLEIIIVDNGSTDGSFEMIKQLLSEVKLDADLNVRVIRLSKNYGFAIANIIAYKLRDPRSKYIALINNDMCPEKDSLRKLITYLEKLDERIAGVQGAILSWDASHILTYGGFVTDHGTCGGMAAFMESSILRKLKPIIATYIDGAYSVYRVNAIEKAGGLFMPYFFMWGDDYELGIRLWRSDFKLIAVPVIAGKHYAGAITTIKGDMIYEPPRMPYIYEYWSWVSNIAVTVVLYGYPYQLQILKRLVTAFIAAMLKKSKAILRGFIDGMRLGMALRKRVLKKRPWLRVPREPRLKSHLMRELAFLAHLYLRYGYRASRIYYILVARALGRRY
jgi:GT2 family glycosyltransferase